MGPVDHITLLRLFLDASTYLYKSVCQSVRPWVIILLEMQKKKEARIQFSEIAAFLNN